MKQFTISLTLFIIAPVMLHANDPIPEDFAPRFDDRTFSTKRPLQKNRFAEEQQRALKQARHDQIERTDLDFSQSKGLQLRSSSKPSSNRAINTLFESNPNFQRLSTTDQQQVLAAVQQSIDIMSPVMESGDFSYISYNRPKSFTSIRELATRSALSPDAQNFIKNFMSFDELIRDSQRNPRLQQHFINMDEAEKKEISESKKVYYHLMGIGLFFAAFISGFVIYKYK